MQYNFWSRLGALWLIAAVLPALVAPSAARGQGVCGMCVQESAPQIKPGYWGPDSITYHFRNHCPGRVTMFYQLGNGKVHNDAFARNEGKVISCVIDECPYTKVKEECSPEAANTRAPEGVPMRPQGASSNAPSPAAADNHCWGLKYADEQSRCRIDCAKDATTCEAWKRQAERDGTPEIGASSGTPLREQASTRFCVLSDARCYPHCHSLAQLVTEARASGCTPRPGSLLAQPASDFAAPKRSRSTPNTGNVGNGCPPGMVHDPRINPNECIRLEYIR